MTTLYNLMKVKDVKFSTPEQVIVEKKLEELELKLIQLQDEITHLTLENIRLLEEIQNAHEDHSN